MARIACSPPSAQARMASSWRARRCHAVSPCRSATSAARSNHGRAPRCRCARVRRARAPPAPRTAPRAGRLARPRRARPARAGPRRRAAPGPAPRRRRRHPAAPAWRRPPHRPRSRRRSPWGGRPPGRSCRWRRGWCLPWRQPRSVQGRRRVSRGHQRPGGRDVALGRRHVARGQGGVGQADQQVRALGRGQPGEQGEAELARLDGLARGDQHAHQHLVGRATPPARPPGRAGGRAAPCPRRWPERPAASARRALSTSRSAAAAGAPAASASSAASSQVAPGRPGCARSTAGHARWARSPPLGREQVVQHGLAGERVAEDEAVAVDLDELRVDGGPQPVDDRSPVDVGDARQQLPVEPAAQHRGGADHPPGRRVEQTHAAPDRLAQARGHRGRELAAPRPTRRPPAAACPPRPGPRAAPRRGTACRRRGRARSRRARRAGVGVARQAATIRSTSSSASGAMRTIAAGSRRSNRSSSSRGVALGPRGRHAQHGLGGQRVAEVVEGGEGLRVGPVQVLHHEHAAPPVAVGAQEPHDRLGEQERASPRRPGRPVAPPGRAPAVRGAPPSPASAGESGTRRRAERPEERLDERAVGHRVGARHRAPGEHRAAARGGGFGGGGGQARLPRARLGDQPDHAAAARGHRVDPLAQQRRPRRRARSGPGRAPVDPRAAAASGCCPRCSA